MSKQLKAAFVKWKIQGLIIDERCLYPIDDKEHVYHAVIYSTGYRCGYSEKLHLIYVRDQKGMPKRMINFDIVYDDSSIENWRKKYTKRVSDVYNYSG